MNMLNDKYAEALQFAWETHKDQVRKGSNTPYISHLLSVSALVIENGGSQDQAIAALLHDAVEDQGGLKIAQTIRERFGSRVADIVLACSDTVTSPKPPWRARKEAFIQKLPDVGHDAWLVSVCDKLHNARSISADLDRLGPDLWRKFKGGRSGTVWYYRSFADFFLRNLPGTLAGQLDEAARILELKAKNEDQADEKQNIVSYHS